MQIRINAKPVAIAEGENLLNVLIRNKQQVTNVCSGQGTCGKCKVQIEGAIPAPSLIEKDKLSSNELAGGIRLACQVKPCYGMEVHCEAAGNSVRKGEMLFAPPQTSMQHTGLRRVTFTVEAPSLVDGRGDWERIEQKVQELCKLDKVEIDLKQLQVLPGLLRQQDFTVTAVLWDNQILSLQPGIVTKPLYGLAVDLGTTNVAVALFNLDSGEQLSLAADTNGQAVFGADVISRIQFANSSQTNRDLLRQAVLNSVNSLISTVCSRAGVEAEDIYKFVAVGNTTMHHLFLGMDVSQLALSPFVPVCTADLEFSAAELGLALHPMARVLMFPNIGGFVGGDTLGAILGAGELLNSERHLLIDIGTNCELYLKAGEVMWVCSVAAGPAFEGAGITCGMRAKPGAIERVSITSQQVKFSVIDGGEPDGICGSGLIEAVAQMRNAGVISSEGSIVDSLDLEACMHLGPGLKKRIRSGENHREFVLHFGLNGKDIVLNQQDINQLQLAKGAICAGIKTLLDKAGVTAGELDSIILAGTFASHLNLASIVDIGMIPCMSIDKLETAGNAPHAGAVRVLFDQVAFDGLREKSRRIIHIELGGSAVFNRYFMESMCLERC